MPLKCRGGFVTFCLDAKSNQKNQDKKKLQRALTVLNAVFATSLLRNSAAHKQLNRHSRHTPGPLFCRAFARFCLFYRISPEAYQLTASLMTLFNHALQKLPLQGAGGLILLINIIQHVQIQLV